MLSITAVNKIKLPPKKIFIVGVSRRKKKAKIIPKIGCKLPIILAVDAEKNFKECSNKLCPTAVVRVQVKVKMGTDFLNSISP
jgi:hypothetical protein